ncbi:MAG: NAD(P)-binding protein [Acidimicrobiales bacterium]
MATIETDYLVIGAGASAMAFTDALITESDVDVVMVDRRHAPGGHWNSAYPFVRLHQPAAFYGVNSRVLGTAAIDSDGPNAGWYERVSAAEIVDYFQRVLDEVLLASGRVRFFAMSDYELSSTGEHRFTSRLTGETTTVAVRRKVVDATYLEASVPSTHSPSFSLDPSARFVAVNGLVASFGPNSGYTVIGAGKTAMDACTWLLDNGVSPAAITWIRPREAWLYNRQFFQPLELVGWLMEGVSLSLEAAATAKDVGDLFARLEACGFLMRLDATIAPTMFRCATVSQSELENLRRIENVVRHGRVTHIGAERIELEHGSIPTDAQQIHVDCTGDGLPRGPARPIFQSDRITLQPMRTCQPTFNAALIGFVESSRDDDAEKNRLCPPNPYPERAVDWIRATNTSQRAETMWGATPDIASWMDRSRLNVARGLFDHLDDPLMQSALGRYLEFNELALEHLAELALANE